MRRSPRLSHPVLLYGDEEEFVSGTVPFVRRGIENDEVVFVAARPDYLETVRADMGADASAATWRDTHVWHPHRTGGRGLWIARQLVDLMEILPVEVGAAVRLHAPVG